MAMDPLICFMTSRPRFVTALNSIAHEAITSHYGAFVWVRKNASLLSGGCRLCQKWIGLLWSLTSLARCSWAGQKKRPWLSKYRLPKNLSQKTKTKQKTQPKQQQKDPFSLSLVSSSFTKSCPSVSSSSTHTHTHILVIRRKVTPPVSRETSIRVNASLRLWTIKRDRAFLPSQYLQFPPTLHKAN